MANMGNQKLKLLTLLRILEQETDSEQGLSMPQIIERLEEEGISAERKSIYRDLNVLRDTGLKIVKLPKRPVEYALLRTDLGLSDVMMLIDVVQSSKFLTDRKSNQLVKSLKDLTSERERKMLDKRVHVQGRIKNQTESVFRNVDTIHEALQLKRKIEFLYFSYGTDLKRTPRREGKRYTLTPVRIAYAYGNYYLAAYSDKYEDISTYRVDRMELLQVSAEPATRSALIANYAFEDMEHQSFGMFDGDPEVVTLRVDAPMMDVIVDRFGRDIELVKSTPSYAEVRVKIRKSPQFFGWLAGLNGGVSIKTPKRLSTEYKEWLKSLIEKQVGE
ncbi:MAG: WYL domain-containing protein [Eggerthellaceae bacterium]|nr:WYL domain-containing protein [Eggerthellaceae bacterium]